MPGGEGPCFSKGDIQILVDLGLTSLEARAYLSLYSLGTATVKSVSLFSKIARQDVYRLISRLQQLGLAEGIIAVPSTYKATSLKDSITILLRRKSEEYTKLQAQTEKFIRNLQTTRIREPPQIDDSTFSILSEKKLLYRTLDEKNRKVEKSLLVAGTWESTRGILFDAELEVFKKALKRGVKIRWITEAHQEDKSTENTLKSLVKNPLFEIRYFVPPIPLQAAIYDEKEAVMCIASLPSPDVTSISSDNIMFVKVVINYWEEIWNSSLKNYCSTSIQLSKKKLDDTLESLGT